MTDEGPQAIIEHAATAVLDGLTRLFGEASPATVFSAPEHVGDHVIISAAAWERAGGFGLGGGGDSSQGFGSGGGGGGMSQGRPVAVIRVGPGGVDVAPVIDLTKIGVTVALASIGVWRALRS